ncbi:MAG: metallophosphoesterase [Bacteroidota bacterium]
MIQYASDLHLEFPANWRWLQKFPIVPVGKVLLLAGDTHHLKKSMARHTFFDWAAANFEQVFLIPGNHEFYGGYDAKTAMELDYEFQIRPNVNLVNNTVHFVGGARVIFTTLWSKVIRHVLPVYRGMNDFRLIRFDNQSLSIDRYNALFDFSFDFLKTALTTPYEGKTIVVTHHLPSAHCNLTKYQNSIINEGFCTDLTDFILDCDADYWIYGHSHGNKKAFKIGETQMLTNQLGYVEMGEQMQFDDRRIIEL